MALNEKDLLEIQQYAAKKGQKFNAQNLVPSKSSPISFSWEKEAPQEPVGISAFDTNRKPTMTPYGTPVKEGAVSDIGSDIRELGTGIKETIQRRGEKQAEILARDADGKQGKLSSIFQTATNLASTATDIIGQAAITAGKLFTSQETEQNIKSKVSDIAKNVLNTPEVQQFIQNYKDLEKESPEMAANLAATVEGGAFMLEFLGLSKAKAGVEAAKGTARTIAGGLESTLTNAERALESAAKGTADFVAPAVNKVSTVAAGVGDLATKAKEAGALVTEGLSDLSSRAKTNITAKVAERQAIKALPAQVQQEAVRAGVDIADVRTVSSLGFKDFEKKAAQKLVDSAKRVSAGYRDTDPGSVVGETISARLKELDSLQEAAGKKVGEIAKNLGTTTAEELQPAIFGSIKKVPGMADLKLTPLGVLDFSNTVLSLPENKPVRDAIRAMYEEAIKSGSGKQKNLIRRELFEILDGKKRSLMNLNETQDKVYQAIRGGLANVLDSKNDAYKAANQEFAQISQPLSEMRKLLRVADPNATDDVLSAAAGTLARRLNSNAISKAEIARVLAEIDEALAAAGKQGVSVKKMQDLYDVLNRYYDIAPRTGFQGGIQSGVESAAGNVSGAVAGAVRGVLGKTDAVRQEALEKILLELLK